MKLSYIPYILCGAFICASCNDFLDVKPVGKLIPTEVTQFENLLNNTRTLNFHCVDNNGGCGLAFFGDNIRISENQAKYYYHSAFVNLDRYAAHIFYEPFENPLSMSYTWEYGVYRAAGLFNNVIEGIEDLGMAEDDYARQVIAQAKAGRAWSYLIGTLAYGPSYDPSGDNDKQTIVYRTSASPSDPNPQLSTTGEMFAYIKEDLDYAVTYCPDFVANPCRASKSAAYALRAMYYMYMRDWQAMYDDADEAWRLGLETKGSVDKLLYDFNGFYYEPDESASPAPGEDVELYLQLKSEDGDTDFDKSYSRENLFYRTAPYISESVYPSDEYLALFDTENDLRYHLFVLNRKGYATTVGEETYDDGIQLYNRRSNKTLENEGITYPELLLMRAEAQARLGGSHLAGALADLNLLRKYRYDNTTSTDLPGGASLTQNELIEEILKERRREQPLASYQRIYDLKRFVYDTGKPWCKTTITHTIGTKEYKTNVDKNSFQMQIKNSYIKYNPQWGLTEWEGTWDPKSAE